MKKLKLALLTAVLAASSLAMAQDKVASVKQSVEHKATQRQSN